jgi:hypothetical protein
MIPLPPESVRAVAAGDEVEVFVPLRPQPNVRPNGFWYPDDGPTGMHFASIKHFNKGMGLAHHPLGEPGTVHGVGEELRGDGQPGNKRVGIARYGSDGEMVIVCAGCGWVDCRKANDCFARMDVLWEGDKLVTPADDCPDWAVRHRVQTTRLGPVEKRDGVWGGVGWVRKVEG